MLNFDANAPKVSVIIPCYNYGQYLDEAVDSVLRQTYQDFEIIVVNDGSTDAATNQLLQAYSKPHTQVIHTENQGVAAARNRGVSAAKGEYILPLDADDKIHASYLEKAVEVLDQHDRVGIVYGDVEFFGEKTGKWELPPYRFPEVLISNVIVCSGLYRKADWEKVGGYKPNMKEAWEDYDFWLSLIELGVEVFHIPEVLFFYRRHSDSRDRVEPGNIGKLVRSYAQLFRNHLDLYTQNIEFIFEHILELSLKAAEFKAALDDCQQNQAVTRSEMQCLTAIRSTLAPLNLRDFNLLIFPDWLQPEEQLGTELRQLLQELHLHPESLRITLLVNTGQADPEEVNLMIAGLAMDLLLTEDLDLNTGIEIALITELSEFEKHLLACCSRRVCLVHDDQTAIAAFPTQTMPTLNLNSLAELTQS